ncbi:MAG: hypothetical protein HOP07_17065 [Bacteriovoracaceae bacterium]|nr:hypothetical protein [Bacteriovoracaceae bacterium]
MKIFLIICLSFLFISNAFAIDQNSIDLLTKKGFQVRMGELTGAGSKMSITRLAGLIHSDGIIMKEEIHNLTLNQTNNPSISDIKEIIVGDSVISAHELEGFFTR